MFVWEIDGQLFWGALSPREVQKSIDTLSDF
jgi:hypothetical protein